MSIKKEIAGVEDIALGTGTRTQIRQGQQVQITELNADNLPYDNAQSTKKVLSDTKASIDAHKNDTSNPHKVTAQDVNAAPIDHQHQIADVNGLTLALSLKANRVHQHEMSDINGLTSALDGKASKTEVYAKTDYIHSSTGGGDANKPIVLNSEGRIDSTMLDISLFTPIGEWTPSIGNEYPPNPELGQFWVIGGLTRRVRILHAVTHDGEVVTHNGENVVFDVNEVGYTFQTGNLAGQTAYNGDTIFYVQEGWILRAQTGFDDRLFYKLDGSQAITAPFAAGGQQLKNVADPTDDQDAMTRNFADGRYVNASGDTITGKLTIEADENAITLTSPTSNYIKGVDDVGNDGWYVGRGSNFTKDVLLYNYHASAGFQTREDGELLKFTPIQSYIIWHEGNIDPVSKSGDTMTGALNVDNSITIWSGSNLSLSIGKNDAYGQARLVGKYDNGGTWEWDWSNALVWDAPTQSWAIGSREDPYKIWHEGNDGSGSGLDADLLDGKDSTEFAPSSHVSDTSNPHGVTKDQVGLGFVVDDGNGSQYLANDGTYKTINSVPQGAIILWSGTSIPSGWALCDGNNGTPNLVDRFVLGSSTANIGDTGGSADAVVVSHDHTFTGEALPGHSHTSVKSPLVYVGSGGSKDMGSGAYWAEEAIDTDSISAGTPSGTISTEGSSGTEANMPPYYKLAYIMKL